MDLKDIKSKKAKAVVLEFAWGLFTYSEYLSWHVSNTLIHYPSLILAILVVKSYGNSKENKSWVNFFMYWFGLRGQVAPFWIKNGH